MPSKDTEEEGEGETGKAPELKRTVASHGRVPDAAFRLDHVQAKPGNVLSLVLLSRLVTKSGVRGEEATNWC